MNFKNIKHEEGAIIWEDHNTINLLVYFSFKFWELSQGSERWRSEKLRHDAKDKKDQNASEFTFFFLKLLNFTSSCIYQYLFGKQYVKYPREFCFLIKYS